MTVLYTYRLHVGTIYYYNYREKFFPVNYWNGKFKYGLREDKMANIQAKNPLLLEN